MKRARIPPATNQHSRAHRNKTARTEREGPKSSQQASEKVIYLFLFPRLFLKLGLLGVFPSRASDRLIEFLTSLRFRSQLRVAMKKRIFVTPKYGFARKDTVTTSPTSYCNLPPTIVQARSLLLVFARQELQLQSFYQRCLPLYAVVGVRLIYFAVVGCLIIPPNQKLFTRCVSRQQFCRRWRYPPTTGPWSHLESYTCMLHCGVLVLIIFVLGTAASHLIIFCFFGKTVVLVISTRLIKLFTLMK